MTELSSRTQFPRDPRKPNFLLIVILASVFILAAFVAAYFLLDFDVRSLLPHRPNPRPNARLVRPFTPVPANLA